MFEFSAWLRNTLAGAPRGFRFDSWLRRTFKSGRRSRFGTIFTHSKVRPMRLLVEELETRTVPTGLQLAPINIFQPYNAALTFTPSSPGAGNIGTPINVEGQVVVGGEHLLEFDDTVGAPDLTHLTATINWSDGTTTTGISSTSTSVAFIEYLGTNGGTTPGTNFAVVTLAAGAHTYDESLASAGANLNYFVSVSSDGAFGGAAGTIQDGTTLNPPSGVADAPLTDTTPTSSVSPLPGQTGFEGVALNNVPIATFNDGDAYATAADYTVSPGSISVTWGANVLQSAAPAPTYTLQPIAGAAGTNWEVLASGVVFAEPGIYHPSVTVLDDGGSTVSMPSTETPSFTISDAPLTNTTPANNTVNAIEGNSFSATLMTFDDANPYAPLSDYSVTSVTYTNSPTFLSGPNYSIVANGAPSGGASHWKIVATGIIAEEGDYGATVSVHDVDGSNASTTPLDSTTIEVGDATLTAGTLSVPTGLSEGATITDQSILTFTDANPYAPATDYTAAVNPGDGASVDITSTPGPNGVIIYDAADSTATASAWIVELTHHYVEEEYSQPFTVQVFDVGGASTTLASGTITVTDPPVVLGSTPVTLPTINEGSNTGTQVVATFTDPAGPEDTSDYAATIDWGDGTASTGTVGNAPPLVNPSFEADSTPYFTPLTPTGWTFLDGGTGGVFRPSNTFNGGNGNHVDPIAWPNGAPDGIQVAYVSGTLAQTTTTDAVPGVTYTLSVYVGTQNNVAGPSDYTVSLLEGATVLATTSGTATFDGYSLVTVSGVSPGSGLLQIQLAGVTNPDDGVSQTLFDNAQLASSVFTVSGSHQYTDESTNNDAGPAQGVDPTGAGNYGGVFNIATTVVHELSTPTPTAVTATIEVDDVQITSLTINPDSLPTQGLEGVALGSITDLATFVDPPGAESPPAGSYSATINWGDDTTSPGTVVITGSNTLAVDAPPHTYAEEGSYSITVTVQHDAEPALTSAPATVDIAEVPVVVTPVGNITPVEGQTTGLITVATFTDPGTPAGEPLDEYAATIAWGDGTTSPGIISGPVDGVFTVKGYHTYAAESDPDLPESYPSYTITVSVQHGLVESSGGLLLVADHANDSVVVVDSSDDAVLGTTGSFSDEGEALQTAITPDRTQGFVTNDSGFVYPITNLATTPAVGAPINIGSVIDDASDMSITPDGKYLLVTGGHTGSGPIAVIDVATDSLLTTFTAGYDIESVDASIPGVVLVTSDVTGTVRELNIDGSGNITDPGLTTISFSGPVFVAAAPGSTAASGSGVVVTYNLDENIVESFTISPTGLAAGTIGTLSDSEFSEGVSAAFNPAGTMVYVFSNDETSFVDAFGFDTATGTLDTPTPAFTIDTGGTYRPFPPFFPVYDPLAVSADGTQLYVSDDFAHAIDVYNAATGAPEAPATVSDPTPDIFDPLGLSLAGSSGSSFLTTASATDSATVSDPPVLFTPSNPVAIPVFGTGLDASGNLLAAGASDSHYTVNFAGAGAGAAVVVTNPDTSFGWQGNTGASQWISATAQATTDIGGGEVGTFDYQTTFDLTGLSPATAVLNLEVSADDYVTAIDLNGVNTGIVMPVYPGNSPWTVFTPATITSGFISGVNTLDFLVSNAGGGPTGLQVQISGAASAAPSTPIPVTLPTINEGQSVANVVVATFTDPGGAEPASSYNATINWGDGTRSPGTVSPVFTAMPQDVNVSVYSGISDSDAGAPYSAFVGSFASPDIQFLTDTGDNWFPLGIPNGNAFGADITGNLAVTTPGTYTFNLDSDDGSELFIDGNLVIDNGGNHGPTDLPGGVTLSAGTHTFEVQFDNQGGPAGVDLNLPAGVIFGTAVPTGAFEVIGSHTYAEESTNNDGGPGDIGGVYQISTTVQHELSSPTPTAVSATIEVDDLPVALANSATNINYGNFAHGPNTDLLALNGSTETVDSWAQQEFFDEGPPPYAQPVGNVLQLTDGYEGPYGYLFGGGAGEAGSAFYPTPISTTASFTTQFQFELHGGNTPGNRGDGITFTLQTGGAGFLGGTGTDLGYAGDEGNSVAVAFEYADGASNVDVLDDGSLIPITFQDPGFSLYGAPVNVWLAYNYDASAPGASTLAVYVSQGSTRPNAPLFTANVELDSFLGSSAFVGFTGGSDTNNSAVEEIRSWQLTSPDVFAVEGQAIPSQTLATFTDPGNILPAGQVLAVNLGVNDPDGSGSGAGYDANTIVTFTDPGNPAASGATGAVDVYNGEITGVTITNPGSGYDANTVVTFTDPTSETAAGASGTADFSTLEEPPADYTVLVNWGDGAGFVSDPNVTVSEGDPTTGVYTITGTHAYAEEGEYTLTVEVIHDNTAPQFVSEPVVVADAPLSNVTSGGPETVIEGSTAPILIGTFTDAGNPDGLPEDYSAEINFGDGASTTLTSAADPADFVYDGGTTFSVYAEHVYEWTPASDGSYTLTATIHHDETPDADGQPISDAITVIDPAVVATAGRNFNGVEGSSTNLVVLATFNDPGDPAGTLENPTDYLATVTWGDGATSTSADGLGDIIILATGDGNYVVEGSHIYAGESAADEPYAVMTTIQETDNAATLSNAATEFAAISDPAVDGTGSYTITAVEGAASTVQTVATFTDPGDAEAPGNYTATINWGDGTSSTGAIVESNQTLSTLGSWDGSSEVSDFGYPDTATYGQIVTATGPTLNSYSFEMDLPASTTFQGEVYAWNGAEATGPDLFQSAATNTAGTGLQQITFNTGGISVTPGSQYVIFASVSNDDGSGNGGWGLTDDVYAGGGFVFLNNGSDASQWTTTPWNNFGGQDLAFTANFAANQYTVAGSHTYAEDGDYTVSTVLSHGTAPSDTVISTAIVSDPAVIPNAPNAYSFSAFEGIPSAQQAVATFTDPGTPAGESLNEYAAVINWGDGTNPTTGTIVNNDGVFTVYGAHTYASVADSGATITVTIDHGSAPSASTTETATVIDPSVRALGGFTILGTEGAVPASQTVAVFSDAGDDTDPGDFSATINWGAEAGPIAVPAGDITYNAGYFTIAVVPPAYVEEGSYPVTVVISHGAAPTVTVTDTAVIADPSVIATATPVSAVEGASFTGTVATFTDPGGNVAAEFAEGDYSATVNWGDGTATTTYTPGAGITLSGVTFTVTGTHTYAEYGSYTTSITIKHGTAPRVTVSSVATVSDPSVILNVTPLAFSAVEGVPSLAQPVATFTDPGGAESVSAYAATIIWGDGAGPSTGTITYAAGAFTVWGAHTYADATGVEMTDPITVTVSHGAATPSSAVTADATVSEPSVILNATPLSFTAVEGAASALQTVATFTDPGGPAVTGTFPVQTPVAGAYTAYINWNDPSAPGAVLVPSADLTFNAVTQTFYVLGSHDYPDDGTYPITVTVFHGTSTGVSTQTATATVSDPAVIAAGGFAFTAVEGALSATQTLATFTDPGGNGAAEFAEGNYSASVNWGDGTAIGTSSVANGGITFNAATGVFTVTGAHDYAQEGTYPITVVLNHDTAPSVTVTDTATVSDPSVILNTPPLTLTAVEGQQFAGTVATFTDPGTPHGPGAYSASIAWGDGNTTPGLISQTAADSYAVSLFHTYAQAGAYSITVTISHGTSTPTTGVTANVTVSDPAVLASGGLTLNAVEGAPMPTQTVATFTDPGGSDPIADYSADVDWTGTGSNFTIGAGTISYNAGNNTFSVTAGGNTFQAGTDTILVRINHETSTPVVVSDTVVVTDPAVIVTGNFELTASRGAAVPLQTVATFTDPGGPEVTGATPNAGAYSATISWGDSTPSVALPASDITYNPATQAFTVSAGGHVYTQNGNYTLTVQVTHPATTGSTVTVNSFVAVVDPSVVLNTTPFTITSLVGTHITSATVATFTDPAGPQVIAGFPVSGAYTAYINWEDGAAGNPDITIGTITYTAATQTFAVKGSHTYTQDSSGQPGNAYPIQVTIAHGNSMPATSVTADATITDPPVLANGNKTVTGVEGAAPASPWLLATFTDPGAPGGAGAGYAATITWGDTTSSAGTIAFNTASGKWQVTGSHTYSSFGTYAIQVAVSHDSTPVTVKDTATIADAPLTAGTLTPPSAPMNVEAPVGSTPAAQQILFTFTDANTSESGSDFTATVSWGDATSTITTTELNGAVSIVSLGGGAFEVKGTHVYTEDYPRTTFSVSVKDAGGAKAHASGSLTVTDPPVTLNTTPLTFLSVVNVLSDIQPVATFTDPGGPEVLGGVPKSGEYSALINWGDGAAPSNGVITYNATTQVFTVSGAHRYGSQAGNPYKITVTVSHGSAQPAIAVTATTTVSGTKLNQTISFPTPTGTYAPSTAVQTITIPLAASATSGLPITYTVKSITLVAGTGAGSIVSATITGKTLSIKIAANTSANFNIVIDANQPGDLNYNAAPQVAATLALSNNRRGSGG